MYAPTLDVYAKLATGCPMSYETNTLGETEFTLGGRMNGAVVLTFTGDTLRDFLAVATEATAASERPATAESLSDGDSSARHPR
ncbi:hypothetical protein [Actinokineospora globicatena]|uniref:hypothetical protein n=1 Tax=Actinokineospora globicatena TaxID=103729 RepID=UPI0020A50C59|nr:hypothetical protein [Actinokineospora globicatena]MCP2303458.1 hypothetical protein [Actinokineospora globicatena]GLW79408.1 hypothetical protein Aglo01_38900 [Actinokineospora globicatena]GLW86182.1 hypothetical protein Aglo02_38210 [Actinokineospora globicatena]